MTRNHWVFCVERVNAGSPVPSTVTEALAGAVSASADRRLRSVNLVRTTRQR